MGKEIERKYLVDRSRWQQPESGIRIMQCYLVRNGDLTLRLRLTDEQAFLTLKGRTNGISRSEFEYAVPRKDALDMLKEFPVSKSVIKTRYYTEVDGFRWEVDVFEGDNAGLCVAEIELPSDDTVFTLPEWAICEVSHDRRYRNAYLADHPYQEWQDK